MKRISLIMGIIFLLLYVNTAYGKSVKPVKTSPGCQKNLEMCTEDLGTCEAAGGQIFPGDGYTDPSFGTDGHGPDLSYTNNGDGTFTDDNTGCMWEIKDEAGGVHDKDNLYSWSDSGTAADGSLFADDGFLDTLNNKCDGDENISCTTDEDCTSIGNELCGLAGYRDWMIPNVKILQSIVDYSADDPSSSVPGARVHPTTGRLLRTPSAPATRGSSVSSSATCSTSLSPPATLPGQFVRAHDWSFGYLLI